MNERSEMAACHHLNTELNKRRKDTHFGEQFWTEMHGGDVKEDVADGEEDVDNSLSMWQFWLRVRMYLTSI